MVRYDAAPSGNPRKPGDRAISTPNHSIAARMQEFASSLRKSPQRASFKRHDDGACSAAAEGESPIAFGAVQHYLSCQGYLIFNA
jgi:hypothetical protein